MYVLFTDGLMTSWLSILWLNMVMNVSISLILYKLNRICFDNNLQKIVFIHKKYYVCKIQPFKYLHYVWKNDGVNIQIKKWWLSFVPFQFIEMHQVGIKYQCIKVTNFVHHNLVSCALISEFFLESRRQHVPKTS